jgi:MFS family permease
MVWGLAAGFYLVALFHRMSLGVASLDARERFDLSAGDIATLSALQLGLYLAMTIPAGLAADRIGPRRALAIGLVLMAVGETAFGLATAAPLALGGRALVGVGDAFMFLSVLRLAQSWFPAARYALLASLTGMAGAIGQIGTTVPLGLALDGASWTATFAGTGVLTGALAIACVRLIQDRPDGAPAPARATHAPVIATLRAAWARPGTRLAFWTHFGLMGPFVAITALWGYPYLVTSQGVAPGSARALLAACVVAFGATAPLIGALAGRRPGLRQPLLRGVAAAGIALWAPALLWPGGTPPVALVAAALVATGVGGAASMLAFDVAREGNPAAVGGSATGLANTGGFTMAVATQLVAGRLLDSGVAAGIPVALLPMVALMALAAVMGARIIGATSRDARRTHGRELAREAA